VCPGRASVNPEGMRVPWRASGGPRRAWGGTTASVVATGLAHTTGLRSRRRSARGHGPDLRQAEEARSQFGVVDAVGDLVDHTPGLVLKHGSVRGVTTRRRDAAQLHVDPPQDRQEAESLGLGSRVEQRALGPGGLATGQQRGALEQERGRQERTDAERAKPLDHRVGDLDGSTVIALGRGATPPRGGARGAAGGKWTPRGRRSLPLRAIVASAWSSSPASNWISALDPI